MPLRGSPFLSTPQVLRTIDHGKVARAWGPQQAQVQLQEDSSPSLGKVDGKVAKDGKVAEKVCLPLQPLVMETNQEAQVMMTSSLAIEAPVGYCSQTDHLKHLAPFQRLRACFQWWEENAHLSKN